MGNTRRTILAALSLAWLALAAPAWAGGLGDGAAIPHVTAAGQAGYRTFADAPGHRAFAIAPGGVWAWVSDSAAPETAELEALDACRQHTEQPCHLYAVNDQVVFDESAWLSSWDLHGDPQAAPVGLRQGDRFPDMALTAPDGQPVTLSDLRGKPVFLHFWGSWCPPCQAEFADIQKFYNALADENVVTFALVQGRESIAKSQRWAAKHGITMGLYDSGAQGSGDKLFRMADGSTLNDRRLVTTYPTTYILDANGLIVFYIAGPAERWSQYAPLIRHLAARASP